MSLNFYDSDIDDIGLVLFQEISDKELSDDDWQSSLRHKLDSVKEAEYKEKVYSIEKAKKKLEKQIYKEEKTQIRQEIADTLSKLDCDKNCSS